MGIRLKILISTAILTFLYAVYFWGIPQFINIENRVEFLQNFISEKTQMKAEIVNPKLKMGLTPSVWLSLDKFELSDKNNKKALYLTDFKINIKLLPFISKKIVVNYLKSDKIFADLKINKENKLCLGNFIIEPQKNALELILKNTNINSYEIISIDEILNKKSNLLGDYLQLSVFNLNKKIKLATSAKLLNGKKHSQISADLDLKMPINKAFSEDSFKINAIITNLDLSYFSNYIAKFSKNDIKKAVGIINFEAFKDKNKKNELSVNLYIDNPKIIRKDIPSSIIVKNRIHIKSLLEPNNNDLIIKTIDIKAPNVNANVLGEIKNIRAKVPTLNLTINILKSRIESIVDLLPGIKLDEEINLYYFKKYGYCSDLEGEVKIKGEYLQPNITGKIISSNAYLIKPLPNNTPLATIVITFLGDKLNMNVKVPATKTETVFVKGDVALYDEKKSDFTIKSTNNVPLDVAEFVLNPLHQILNFELGPVPVMKIKGFGSIDLDVKGNRKGPHLNGWFKFNNTTASFNGINMQVKNGMGQLDFKDQDTHFYTKKAFLNKQPISIDGTCNLFGELDFDVFTDNQQTNSLLTILKTSPMLSDVGKMLEKIKKTDGKLNLKFKLFGQIKDINEEIILGKNIFAKGSINLINNTVWIENLPKIANINGIINFANIKLNLDLNSTLNSSKIYIKGIINNTFADLNVYSKRFNLKDIAKLLSNQPNLHFISDFENIFINFSANYKGDISNINPNDIILNADLDLSQSKIKNASFNIYGGSIKIVKNTLIASKLNVLFDEMPIFIDGKISEIFNNPIFNIYLNLKPNSKFIDNYYNKKNIYPIKLRGDITLSSKLTGHLNQLQLNSKMILEPNAYLYYMGATLGDNEFPVIINSKSIHLKNRIEVLNFGYNKLISSQNNRFFNTPFLQAKGIIDYNGNKINLKNFRIKTFKPTEAQIFNVIFTKPIMKEGFFQSDLTMNGNIYKPNVYGDISFTDINFPLLDTTVKDIKFDFKKDFINLTSTYKISQNKFIMTSKIKNVLAPPFTVESLNIKKKKLNLDKLITLIKDLDIKATNDNNSKQKPLSMENLVIKNARITADTIYLKNITAKNLTTDFQITDKMLLNLHKYKLNIDDGEIYGDLNYNFLNNFMKIEINLKNVESSLMAEFLDLDNQLYGKANSNLILSCNAKSHDICMNTLSGNIGFDIKNGKMPKLGSLEYLLKAGNLLKSGITGLSINNIIKLVAPLKTGNFKIIKGNATIDNGIANSIQILSRGEDLSLFLSGNYNFSTLVGDMNILGRLSKKATTVLGPVGNISLNSLFNKIPGLNLDDAETKTVIREINKIPGIELNEKLYRIF